jgi:hypothetical protein
VPDDRDRVAAAVAELYGAVPEAFTGRRGELVAAARADGDRTAAKAIGELRRPTRAAWVVNQLAREDPSAPRKLAELSAALRAAQQAGHGPRLRELSAARGALVDALTAQALSLARVADAPSPLREEVSGTLTAAVADPAVADAFAAGTLTRAAQWSGFGVLPPVDGEAGPSPVSGLVEIAGRPAERPAPAGAERRVEQPAGASSVRRVPADRTRPGGARAPLSGVPPQTGARSAGTDEAAAQRQREERRQREEEERLAREAAERAARRREQFEDAERAVASASAAATEAVTAEDRLEAEVRQLEQRLTEARSELAAARMRARHAEAAERRARQAFERLPGG